MITKFIHGKDIALALKQLISEHTEFYWAIAWGADNHNTASELMKHTAKIRKLVIGTHFYQTDPEILEKLKLVKNARVVIADGIGVFHPKLYLFFSRDHAAAIIGSANFTRGAFSVNVEACALIEGKPHEKTFLSVKAFIETECWPKARQIDEDFLRAYRIQHEATRQARQTLEKFVKLKRPSRSARGDPLEMNWADFVAKVRADKFHSLDRRLKMLANARSLFEQKEYFRDFTTLERKAIAGTIGKNERAPLGDVDWGWFGSMVGFGVFKNRINTNAPTISEALDCIPLTGPVAQSDYENFIRNFLETFEGEDRKAGIPSASRLLAMKRPDYFVCVDKANKAGLSAHFGVAASAVNMETYWTDIIEPITYSQWWRTSRPRAVEGRIWDSRAAFLDAIYYVE